MASNDSGAAVAATVNAVTPLVPPPQADNKGQEAKQANHNSSPSSTTNTEGSAALSDIPDASAATAKEIQKTEPLSSPAVNNTSTPSIPSSNTSEANASESVSPSSSSSSQPADTVVSPSQSKPAADSSKPAMDTAVTNASEGKKDENCNKEPEPKPEPAADKKAEQTSAPSSDGDKAGLLATNESPSMASTETKSNNNTGAEKPTVSGSDNKQSATTTESPPAVEASAKPKPSTPAVSKPIATIKPMVESTASSDTSITPMETSKSNTAGGNPKSNNKRPAEDEESSSSDKKIKSSTASSSTGGQKDGSKTAKEVFEYMDKTFDQRRKIITKQMPTIPELKSMYPELFMCKQLLLEFQRITKIDIDQKIQEFCVRYATAVIEMARSNKAAAPVLARWEKAKQENETLKQYWDMVTALCLLPLHFGENFVEMVLEIGEDEEVKAQGKIVPTLVARGNIFRTDEFFLIAENTIVQEFEEFTIAFASLYSSYWVFNMVYPETIENTYNYIQRCIVRQREPGAISAVCKNFTKSLQKWNKDKEGK